MSQDFHQGPDGWLDEALSAYGEALLPPGFDARLRSFRQMMRDVETPHWHRGLQGDVCLPRPVVHGMSLTTDPSDPRLTHGADDPAAGPVDQAETYLVLSEQQRALGFVRPVRRSYWHTECGAVTTMAQAIAETYARQPGYYGNTYCAVCQLHRPVGPDGEFHWVDPAHPERQSPTLDPKVGT